MLNKFIKRSLLNKSSGSIFVSRKWCIVNDQWNANYDVGNEIIYNTEILKSNLCDYNDAYILVKGNIAIAGNIAAWVTFKICAPLVYHKNWWNNSKWC